MNTNTIITQFTAGFYKEAADLGMNVEFLKGLVAESDDAVQKWSAAFDEIEQQTGDKHFRFKVAGELAELLKDQPDTPMQKQANDILQQILQWVQQNPELLAGGGIGGLLGLLLGQSSGNPLMGLLLGGLGGAGLGYYGKQKNWWNNLFDGGRGSDSGSSDSGSSDSGSGSSGSSDSGSASASSNSTTFNPYMYKGEVFNKSGDLWIGDKGSSFYETDLPPGFTPPSVADELAAQDAARNEENTGGPTGPTATTPTPEVPPDPAQAAYDQQEQLNAGNPAGNPIVDSNLNDDPEAVSRGHTQEPLPPGLTTMLPEQPPGLLHDPQFNYDQQEQLNAGNPILDPRLRGADQVMLDRLDKGLVSPDQLAEYNRQRTRLDLQAQLASQRNAARQLDEQIDDSWALNPGANARRAAMAVVSPIQQAGELATNTYNNAVDDLGNRIFSGAETAKRVGDKVETAVRNAPGQVVNAVADRISPITATDTPSVPRVRPPLVPKPSTPPVSTNPNFNSGPWQVPNNQPVVPPQAQPR